MKYENLISKLDSPRDFNKKLFKEVATFFSIFNIKRGPYMSIPYDSLYQIPFNYLNFYDRVTYRRQRRTAVCRISLFRFSET